jgi:hypothetical protein
VRLARGGAPIADRERDVRMLALLVKTLRELSAFEAGAAKQDETDDDDDDYEPRDMDALRAELLRRLNAMAESEKARREVQAREEGESVDPPP